MHTHAWQDMQDAETRLLEEREGALAHEKEALSGWQAACRELEQAEKQIKVCVGTNGRGARGGMGHTGCASFLFARECTHTHKQMHTHTHTIVSPNRSCSRW